MSGKRVDPTDPDRQAFQALLEQLRRQSADALAVAERWFGGDEKAAGTLGTLLSQLAHVAELAQMEGVSLLAAECGAMVARGAEGAAREALAEGLVALSAHLDDATATAAAPLERFLLDINALRTHTGREALASTGALAGRLLGGGPYPVPFAGRSAGMPDQQAVAAKVRDPAKNILAAFRRAGTTRPPVEALLKLVRTLERSAGDAAAFEPWWLARILLDNMQSGALPVEREHCLLLADLEPFLVALAAKDTPEVVAWVPRAVAVLATLPAETEDLVAVATCYGLKPGAGTGGDSALAARQAAALAAREELGRIRDAFDMFARSGGKDTALLGPAMGRLDRLIGFACVAGLVDVDALLVDARETLRALTGGEAGPATSSLVADTLLHAEEVLKTGVGGPAEKLRTQAIRALMDVALEVLAEIRPGLVEAAEVEDPHALRHVPDELFRLANALLLAGLDGAASVAEEVALRVGAIGRDSALAEHLAEALICLELALRQWRDGASGVDERLDRARRVLEAAPKPSAPAPVEAVASEPPVVADEVDPEILGIFLEEAREHVDAARAALAQLRDHPGDAKARMDLQRAFHTIKGSGRMAGTPRLAEFAWAFESLLKRASEGSAQLGSNTVDLIACAVVLMPVLLEQVESGGDPGVDLAPLVAAAAHDDEPGERFSGSLLPRRVAAHTRVVGSWLDVVRKEKGSGRVPQPVLDALLQLRTLGETLAAADVTAAATRLLDQLETAGAVDDKLIADTADILDGLDSSISAATGAGSRVAIESYRDEARSLLDRMSDACDALLLDAGDADAVLGLQRVLHTLKGSSRVAQFTALSDIAHDMESVLQAVGDERMIVTPRLIWMLQRLFDAMYGMLDPGSAETASIRARTLLGELTQLSGDDRSVPSGAERRRKPRLSVDSERVRSDQFDRALVRALSLGLRSAQMEARMGDLTMWSVATIGEMLSGLVEDAAAIRDALIRARTAPVHLHADRWRRAVRQAAEDAGRTAELRFENSALEVDRRLLDRILLPLEHLLRNAVGHGIEPSVDREAAGKEPAGTIVIRAALESDGIVIEVEDDGAGIDVDKVRKRAAGRDMELPAGELSQDALLHVIATPGFSTSGNVTHSSGYGMGVSAVMEAVKEMGGHLTMETVVGHGTRFVIHLPNPSPVMSVELLRVGNALVAVPTPFVVIARSIDEGADAVAHEGEHWPFVEIAPMIGVNGAHAARDAKAAVLLKHRGTGAALRVDELLGKVETAVHRLLGAEAQDNECVAGVGLLDGGRLCTVLNVEAVLAAFPAAVRIRPLAIVADDSPTARDEVARKLEELSWRVVTADDGHEAKRVLSKERPRLVVLDIDMPGYDGLELLEWARSRKGLAEVPIIMVSAALDENRRARAAAFKALACVDKPFKPGALEAVVATVDASVG